MMMEFLVSIKELLAQAHSYGLHSSSSSSSSNSNSFCSPENFRSAVVYLSQEVQSLGLNYKLLEAGGELLNLISLVNCFWEVTQLYHSSVKSGNYLQDQRRKDAADLSHLQGTLRELKGTVSEKEKIIVDTLERERQIGSINKTLSAKLKIEKDEVRRLSSVLQQREAQYQHEIRKKECENGRLKDRLRKLFAAERTGDTRPASFTVTSTLYRSDKTRGKWKTDSTFARHEEELHIKVLSQYESWVGQLNSENDQLKECLSNTCRKVSKIASKMKLKKGSSSDVLNFSSDSLEEPVFSCNFPSVREQIISSFEDDLQIITDMLHKYELQCNQLKDQNVTFIKKNLSDSVISKGSGSDEGLPEGKFIEEFEELERRREEFKKEKDNFQEEKQRFTDAALRLNRERATFESEKLDLLRQQFLTEFPTSLRSQNSQDSGVSCISSAFVDSPRRISAVPTIVSPQGCITSTKQPITLGLTCGPKCAKDARSSSSLRNQRSTTTSRASSLPRPEKESCSSVIPEVKTKTSFRSSTLERPKKQASKSRSSLQRSHSQVFSTALDIDSGLSSLEDNLVHNRRLSNVETTHSASTTNPFRLWPNPEMCSSRPASFVRAPRSQSLHQPSSVGPRQGSDSSSSEFALSEEDHQNEETHNRLSALEDSLMDLLCYINQRQTGFSDSRNVNQEPRI